MADLDVQKAQSYVVDLLRRNKALTEREVKARLGKAFRLKPAEIGAGLIRQVRRRMGIDRPAALAYARAMLRKEPLLQARKVIGAVGEKFGIRLGPPDVSRMRPKRARAGRGRAGRRTRRPAGRRAAAPAAARGRVRRRPGRPSRGAISVTYQGTGSPEALAAFFRSLGG